MLHKNPLKLIPHSLLATVMFLGLTQLAHATDARTDNPRSKTTSQPETKQPQQQAAPAKPAVEPVDDDDDTALA